MSSYDSHDYGGAPEHLDPYVVNRQATSRQEQQPPYHPQPPQQQQQQPPVVVVQQQQQRQQQGYPYPIEQPPPQVYQQPTQSYSLGGAQYQYPTTQFNGYFGADQQQQEQSQYSTANETRSMATHSHSPINREVAQINSMQQPPPQDSAVDKEFDVGDDDDDDKQDDDEEEEEGMEDYKEMTDASWEDVLEACCCHTAEEWAAIGVALLFLLFFLYFFLVGLELLGSSAKVIGGCTAGDLLGDDTNPVAGIMIGILATVLLQSSSTATSIIVSLVGSNVLATRQAIYIIMGANIGTSVTNTIVAMGQMGDADMLERAFAGATVHDMFNFLSVAVLLPVEAITGYLYEITKALVSPNSVRDGEKWNGPVKRIVAPLGARIIVANKDIIKLVAKGGSCDSFYPIQCDDPSNPTTSSCNQTGLIACDKQTNRCPAFFQVDATQQDDEVSGGVCFVISLAVLVCCLAGLITILQRLLLGISARVVYKASNINGYLSMMIGCGITILVQSSSITTSTLTPLVGVGVIQLEQMFALTLGCNIGTTVTALLAALVSDKVESLQVALAHLFFNISGILIWYPIPYLRRIPMNASRRLGRATRYWRMFPIFYIAFMFFLLPLALLGVASIFDQDALGYDVLGAAMVVGLGALVIWLVFWWEFQHGKEKCIACLQARDRRAKALRDLPDDLDYIRQSIAVLAEYTGLDDDDDNDNDGDEDEERGLDSKDKEEESKKEDDDDAIVGVPTVVVQKWDDDTEYDRTVEYDSDQINEEEHRKFYSTRAQ